MHLMNRLLSWMRGLTALELKLESAFGKTEDMLDEDSVVPLAWQEILVLKEGAGATETEVTLGGAAGTRCMLHQRQRLLPGITEEEDAVN